MVDHHVTKYIAEKVYIFMLPFHPNNGRTIYKPKLKQLTFHMLSFHIRYVGLKKKLSSQ